MCLENWLFLGDNISELIEIIGEKNFESLTKLPADPGNEFEFIDNEELKKFMDYEDKRFYGFEGGLLKIKRNDDGYFDIISKEDYSEIILTKSELMKKNQLI